MTSLRAQLGTAALVLIVAGCAAPAPVASPSAPAGLVTRPEQAVARVIATEPRLAGIAPLDANVIGQASWYEVAPASGVGAFVVSVRVGWGDCEAGCIDEHRWVYAVTPDGAVSVVSESGGPVPADAWPTAAGAGGTGIGGRATAGPVCPVERTPPDPACAPSPVAGATLTIRDGAGVEVFRAITGADGTFFAELQPGRYVVEPQPVEGLMGTAPAQDVTVAAGATSAIEVVYDTGIRGPASG